MKHVGAEISEPRHLDYTGSKLGMWLFLFTEILLFGGLFLVYSVYRSAHSVDFHRVAAELSLPFGAANTVILITSSLTMALSISAIRLADRKRSILFLSVTIFLGLVFLVNKYFEWSSKIHHGIYPGSTELLSKNHGEILFYGLYYVMTGLHGLHVLGGVALLGVMLYLLKLGGISHADFGRLENSGLYWHLVDLIWIYLFPLFYLIT